MSIVRVTPKEESRESGERNCAAQMEMGTMGRTFPPPPIDDVSLDRASSVVAVTDESIYHACAKIARHKIGWFANRRDRCTLDLGGSEFIPGSSHGMEVDVTNVSFYESKVAQYRRCLPAGVRRNLM